MLKKILFFPALFFSLNSYADSQSACEITQSQCTHPMPGQFCPQCDKEGHYKLMQCSGSTGFCWCVDPATGDKTKEEASRNPTSLSCYTKEN